MSSKILDPNLEISKGTDPRHMAVNKFGRSTNVDMAATRDIWDLTTQAIWLAPTAARIHTIASDSAADVLGGTGATTVIISYLPDWDTAETTETVTGDLNAGIAMNNAAVMIHRMYVVPQATSTTTNVGTITATAAADATITAQINPLMGQTLMAIYGIPSVQNAHMDALYASLLRASAATALVDTTLVYNPNPDVQTLAYLTKHTSGMVTSANNPFRHGFKPHKKFAGPGILKIQGNGSANDLDVSAGFDLVLHTKGT